MIRDENTMARYFDYYLSFYRVYPQIVQTLSAQFKHLFPNQAIPISQQLVAKLPWGHNVILIDKLDSTEYRLWYAQKTAGFLYSTELLLLMIIVRAVREPPLQT